MLNSVKTFRVSGISAILMLALFIVASAGFAVIMFTSNENTFTEDTNPLNVTVTLSKARTAKEVTPRGGSVQLQSGDGTKAELILDEDSLFETKEIAVTAIKTIGTMNTAWKFVAGSQLKPDKTMLGNEAELRIQLPAGLDAKGLVGFAYEGDGKDFHLYPMLINDGTAVFKLHGFSGYGIIKAGDASRLPPLPSSIEMQAQQHIAAILIEAQRSQAVHPCCMPDEFRQRIKNILKGWYEVSIKERLAKAADDGNNADGAVHEFLSWQQSIMAYGFYDDFEVEEETSLGVCARVVSDAVEKAEQRPDGDKGQVETATVLRLNKLAVILGLGERNGPQAK